MNKPILVIMAAGMGSRYGGLKQIDPVGPNGELILDYSVYDAIKAGFDKLIIVIKKEMLEDFNNIVGKRIGRYIDIEYAFQRIDDLPEGFKPPAGRVKPWGTAHAVMSARNYINEPFAVINADDFYGREGFEKIYDFLKFSACKTEQHYAMVGYKLIHTLSDNGYVGRGVCTAGENGMLESIIERTRIERYCNQARYSIDGGETWITLPEDTIVSMNFWGFTPPFFDECEKRFMTFLNTCLKNKRLECEYFLPSVVDELIKEKKAGVKILTTDDKWHGVTYKDDKPLIMQAINKMIEKGLYNKNLWSSN